MDFNNCLSAVFDTKQRAQLWMRTGKDQGRSKWQSEHQDGDPTCRVFCAQDNMELINALDGAGQECSLFPMLSEHSSKAGSDDLFADAVARGFHSSLVSQSAPILQKYQSSLLPSLTGTMELRCSPGYTGRSILEAELSGWVKLCSS